MGAAFEKLTPFKLDKRWGYGSKINIVGGVLAMASTPLTSWGGTNGDGRREFSGGR